MRSPGRLACAALIAALASACQQTANVLTGYKADTTALRAQPPTGSLAVMRFEDARPPRTCPTQGELVPWGVLLPLVPYQTVDYERLDESIGMGAAQRPGGHFEDYTYPASFPRAIATDLAETGLFTSCQYVGTEAGGDARYALEGTLRETPLHRLFTSYMLGPWGVLLWSLSLPAGKTSAAVNVDLRLTDRRNGKEVWRGTLDGDASRLITLYTSSTLVYWGTRACGVEVELVPSDARVNSRSLFSWHFEALRRAMAKARPEIAAALTRYEASAPR